MEVGSAQVPAIHVQIGVSGSQGAAEVDQAENIDPTAALKREIVLIAIDGVLIATAIQNSYSSTTASESTGLALQSVSSVRCAGEWAVAQVVIGDGQGHDLHDHEVAQRVDGRWVVADPVSYTHQTLPTKRIV